MGESRYGGEVTRVRTQKLDKKRSFKNSLPSPPTTPLLRPGRPYTYSNVMALNEIESTPLHFAARAGAAGVAKLLLDRGANAFVKDTQVSDSLRVPPLPPPLGSVLLTPPLNPVATAYTRT